MINLIIFYITSKFIYIDTQVCLHVLIWYSCTGKILVFESNFLQKLSFKLGFPWTSPPSPLNIPDLSLQRICPFWNSPKGYFSYVLSKISDFNAIWCHNWRQILTHEYLFVFIMIFNTLKKLISIVSLKIVAATSYIIFLCDCVI